MELNKLEMYFDTLSMLEDISCTKLNIRTIAYVLVVESYFVRSR